MDEELQIRDRLNRVDWDFSGSSTLPNSVHSLHWYPGNVLPQIPSYLISLLSKEGNIVFDPFCGSGTVGVEALLLGRRCWQSDVCRAALQVTRGKLACIFNPSSIHQLNEIYNQLFFEEFCSTDKFGHNNEGSNKELEKWFSRSSLGQLRYLWSLLESPKYENVREILEMLFTDTLFSCSSTLASRTTTGKKRRHHWGWVADNVIPKKLISHNVIRIFREKLLQSVKIIDSLQTNKLKESLFQDELSVVRLEDARQTSVADNSVDLIVTSPPYIGMTDYTLANRLTYLWIGWFIEEDFEAEIGSRRRRNRKYAELEYIHQIIKAWENMHRALKSGGICAALVGASRKFPNFVVKLINEINQVGFKVIWGPTLRRPSRRRVSDRLGAKSHEFLCVWRKIL